MFEGASQTPLTEFVRHGATASAGTVTEPYAIQAKFPDPFIHVHYAHGCTLAEAFYQSVRGPYQLLIVGDPLCRPWADIPEVTVRGVKPGETIKGQVSLRPGVQTETEVDGYDLYIDGRRHPPRLAPSEAFDVDTRGLCDGYHELRIVAVTDDPIETQGEVILPVHVDNYGHRLRVTPPADRAITWGQPIRLSAELPHATTISFSHNQRRLAATHGAAGEVEIDSRQLGLGVVQIQAVAQIGGRETILVTGEPVEFKVVPPPALAALEVDTGANWAKGLELTPDGREPVAIESTKKGDWLAEAGVKAGEGFSLVGYFEVPEEDVYQFQVYPYAKLTLQVDSTVLAELTAGECQLLPIALAAGTHKLTVHGVAPEKPRLSLRFGGPGALSVGADRFRHLAQGGE